MITLKDGKIIDQCSSLPVQGQGDGGGLLQGVGANLEKHPVSRVICKRQWVAPGRGGSAKGCRQVRKVWRSRAWGRGTRPPLGAG